MVTSNAAAHLGTQAKSVTSLPEDIGELTTERARVLQLAEMWRIPVVNLRDQVVQPDALQAVPEALIRKLNCLPLRKDQPESDNAARTKRATLFVVVPDPSDLNAIEQIEFASGCRVKLAVASAEEIKEAIDRHYSPERWIEQLLSNIDDSDSVQVIAEREVVESESTKEAPAVKLVNLILQNAIDQGASDIHLEPTAHGLLVRNRIGGLLREFASFPKWLQRPLVARVKVLASLDIADQRRPQDGRMKVQLLARETDVRVSTLPAQFGEKVVMRILGSLEQVPDLGHVHMDPDNLATLRAAMAQPQGMILVTGPTGSGKTTTLYSMLNERRNPTINIVTVEDPIEIQLPGLNQVQVNPKADMTFASCLRSILRQDPDVILVGEIRDQETQEIAFNAALTGHLVLSTLHTNGTIATITRLLDLGVDPFVISDALHLIVAQRLVRGICPDCKDEYEPSPTAIAQLGLKPEQMQFVHGRGCKSCGGTGYKGRFGIFEMLRMTPALRELISTRATEPELRRAAIAGGCRMLLDQALLKVAAGATTVEEVLRVIAVDAPPELVKPAAEVSESPLPSEKFHDVSRLDEPPAVPTKGSDARNLRILVVEDDAVSRHFAVHALKQLDCDPEVLAVDNGFAAIEVAETKPPDLVVLDIMMPGISGIEVCRKLRANVKTAFVPVLMLTASASDEHRLQGFVAGTDDYMNKPVSVAELHARVNRLIQRAYVQPKYAAQA